MMRTQKSKSTTDTSTLRPKTMSELIEKYLGSLSVVVMRRSWLIDDISFVSDASLGCDAVGKMSLEKAVILDDETLSKTQMTLSCTGDVTKMDLKDLSRFVENDDKNLYRWRVIFVKERTGKQ